MMEDNKEILEKIEETAENLEEITSLIEEKSDKNSLDKKDEKAEKQIEFKLDNLNLSKSNVINILEDLRIIKKRYIHIENILKEAERAQYSPSRDLPGVVGKYDGEFMITSDGVKHEVPKNYAAKSLLVYGDELKMMEQDGKVAFKIVNKVPRKKIEGLLSKKDGRYVILSDNGTFNLLKTAVEFRNIKQGEWVLAVIPESGTANNFAAIDKIIKKETKKEVKFYDKPKSDSIRTDLNRPQNHSNKPNHSQPKVSHNQPHPAPKPATQPQTPPQAPQPKREPEEKPAPKSPMPKIQFSDEDLV